MRTDALNRDGDILSRKRDARLQKERRQQDEKLGIGGNDVGDIDPGFKSRNIAIDA